MAVRNLFASPNLPEHLLRGGFGLSAWIVARQLFAMTSISSLIGAFILIAASLVVLRGCPVCWTIGLLNTSRNAACPIPKRSVKAP
jgi:hypothetical protein